MTGENEKTTMRQSVGFGKYEDPKEQRSNEMHDVDIDVR